MLLQKVRTMVQTWTAELLRDSETFRIALQRFVEAKAIDIQTSDKVQSVPGLLLLIDFVLEMMRDAGLVAQYRVYAAVKQKTEASFERAVGCQRCAISGLMSARCLRVAEAVVVEEQYKTWLCSVWLLTHMLEIEQQRRRTRCQEVPAKDAELYREAFLFVIDTLENMYAILQNFSSHRTLPVCQKKRLTQSI